MKFPIAPALILSILAVGCSSSAGSAGGGAQSSSAPANASATSPQTVVSSDAAESATSTLPLYPGAEKLVLPSGFKTGMPTICGSKLSMSLYNVSDVAEATVAKWYAGQMSGAIPILVPLEGSSEKMDELMLADGSGAVVVSQMSFSSSVLAKAAKSMGADKTNIGLETYQPSLPSDVVQIMSRYATASPADQSGLKDQLKQKCPDIAAMSAGG